MAQTMPPIIRRAQARGEAIGEQRGVQIGEQNGRGDTLLRLLQFKFGPLPADIRARIDRITEIDRLDRLIDAVLTAETLVEMRLSD